LRGHDERVTLDRLGFSAASGDAIRAHAGAPSGMLLVTGPTGSGKTTTVYAALSEINTGLEKIITIEDPVEYELPGVLQIPVNERKGLTFATGLRSILRHDPDRILVGEIRDAETAEIAVQSALTGHLVFTTVHANSVADVVGRFRHFGIDMFGFMASSCSVWCVGFARTARSDAKSRLPRRPGSRRRILGRNETPRRRWVAPNAGTRATRDVSSLPKYIISTTSCATTSQRERRCRP
jgi:type II secretory ATPase GspE/PulE/Tfp pilus assembly ATPase PilB-like protein